MTAIVEMPMEAVTVTAAPPDMLSQKNVEAVTGIPARVYLEEIRSPRFPLPVVKLGKLRLVNRVAFLGYLESLASRPGLVPRHADDEASEDEGFDALLAEVGLKRRAPSGSPRAPQLPPGSPAARGKLLPK